MSDTTRPTIELPAGEYIGKNYLDCVIVLTEPHETIFTDCTFRLVHIHASSLDLTTFTDCSWYDCGAHIEYAGGHATPHVLSDMNLHIISPCVMSECTARDLGLVSDPHAVIFPAGLWMGESYAVTARYYAHPHSVPAVATRSTEGVMWDGLAQWISDVRADLMRGDSPYSMIELTARQLDGAEEHVYLALRYGGELWARSSSVIGDARFIADSDEALRYYVPMDAHRATIVRCVGYAPVVERDAERAVHLVRAMTAGRWSGEVLVLGTDGTAVYVLRGATEDRLDTTTAEIEAHATHCTCPTDLYGCPADAHDLLSSVQELV